MKQLRYKRRWKDIAFNPGGTDTIDLPINFDLEGLHLYLFGSINVTAAYASILSEGLSKLIRRVEILANGETIASVPGTFLVHGNFARDAGVIKVNPGTAIANYPGVECVGFLDQALIGGMRPKDSNLRTAGFRQHQLRVIWGQLSDMYTGAGAATPSLTLSVSVYEERQLSADAQVPECKRFHRFVLDKPYANATSNERILLDPNVLYRGLVLRTENNGELSTAVLNNIKVMYGSDVIFDMSAQACADANTQDNGWAMPAGYYLVDMAPAQSRLAKISDFLDTYENHDAYLILDVNGGAGYRVQAVAHQFEWLPEHIAHNRGLAQARK